MTRSRRDTEDVVRTMVSTKLGVDPKKVTLEASFMDDLAADGISCMELLFDIEKKFDVAIPDEDAERLTTVGKVIEYLTRP